MNRTITYSPAYTLVPTYECFNRCSYCNFRTDIGKDSWLTLSVAQQKLDELLNAGIIEILILSGEVHPQSPRRKAWFDRIYQICELALRGGFLPHTNVGPLSQNEMARLKEVNVSMGLMLEQLNPKFSLTIHRHAPSKDPQLRLQQLELAGKLQIPFTTGLLLGIGETKHDRQDSLRAIAKIQQSWGHIQEVILQPYSWGTQQVSELPSFDLELLPDIVAQARQILPDSIAIQIPPNLIDRPSLLLACLEAGARDLGGISPKDEVNPDYPHPTAQSLQEILEPAGWQLQKRLPVYPQYFSWLSPSLQQKIECSHLNTAIELK
jgi:7,8-didemethyl-8-hydroxy-5-deazariboflavin synthase